MFLGAMRGVYFFLTGIFLAAFNVLQEEIWYELKYFPGSGADPELILLLATVILAIDTLFKSIAVAWMTIAQRNNLASRALKVTACLMTLQVLTLLRSPFHL